MRKRIQVLLFTMAIIGCLTSQSQAQNFPTKPVEIMCMLAPGSSMDIMGRLVAEIGPKYLGQPMVVINKPGAAGALVAMDVINSKPDGYKVVTLSTNSFMSTFKTQKIMFNPDDLVPLWAFLMFKTGMFVQADSPWKTLQDLLDYAKKNPGKVTWGHHGRGLSVQVAAALIFKHAGVQLTEIPHKGSPESMAALLGGHIDVLTTSYATVAPHIQSGKLRALVVYSDRRFSDRPDVPCSSELGFPELDKLTPIVGLYGHKDTPPNVKKILSEAFRKTCEDPAFKQGIEKVGEEYRCETPEFSADAARKGTDVTVPLLKELGIYVEQGK